MKCSVWHKRPREIWILVSTHSYVIYTRFDHGPEMCSRVGISKIPIVYPSPCAVQVMKTSSFGTKRVCKRRPLYNETAFTLDTQQACRDQSVHYVSKSLPPASINVGQSSLWWWRRNRPRKRSLCWNHKKDADGACMYDCNNRHPSLQPHLLLKSRIL